MPPAYRMAESLPHIRSPARSRPQAPRDRHNRLPVNGLQRTTVFLGLIAVFLGANIIGPSFFWDYDPPRYVSLSMFFALGGLVSEVLLLAIWAALGPMAIKFRLPLSGAFVLVAACALVDADTRVLIAQRPPGRPLAGLWEFPGGKVEAGERPEQTLIRELREEVGIVVSEACLAPLTFASHAYPDFHLLMPLYVCRRWEGQVSARHHARLAWVRPNRLKDYPMPPADLPLIPHLTALL